MKFLFHKGHKINTGRIRIPREIRTCSCGCGQQFKVLETSPKKLVNGHHTPKNISLMKNRCKERHELIRHKTYEEIYGIDIAKEIKEKRSKSMLGKNSKYGLETRYCECGCGKSFIVKTNSPKRFVHGHVARTVDSWKIGLKKMILLAKKKKGKTYEGMYGKKEAKRRKEIWLRKVLAKVCCRPNNFEKKCGEKLSELFSDNFKYCGDGSILINGKSPDFISEKLQIVVLCNGLYWHLGKFGLKDTLENRIKAELRESSPFIKVGYEVWFIWEIARHKIKIDELKIKKYRGKQIG